MYYFSYFMFFIVFVCVWSLSLDYISFISSKILVPLIILSISHVFNDNKIGVIEVCKVNFRTETARAIILQNKNWIGSGLFLGKPDVFVDFELQYKQRVLYFLSQGLMNVEQHILFSMYTSSERENNPITVEVQTYIPGTKKVICADPWFYLGCLMYREIQD